MKKIYILALLSIGVVALSGCKSRESQNTDKLLADNDAFLKKVRDMPFTPGFNAPSMCMVPGGEVDTVVAVFPSGSVEVVKVPKNGGKVTAEYITTEVAEKNAATK